jgi:hypothetical protein
MIPRMKLPLTAAAIFLLAICSVVSFQLLRDDDSKAPSGAIWKVGTAWTVTTTQNSAAVSPDTEENDVVKLRYNFKVVSGPKGPHKAWVVHASLENGEGFAANGWDLTYRETKKGMALFEAGPTGREPVPANAASAILGFDFPLEPLITKTPKSHSAKRRTSPGALPPGEGPAGGDGPGGLPPKMPAQ